MHFISFVSLGMGSNGVWELAVVKELVRKRFKSRLRPEIGWNNCRIYNKFWMFEIKCIVFCPPLASLSEDSDSPGLFQITHALNKPPILSLFIFLQSHLYQYFLLRGIAPKNKLPAKIAASFSN